MVDRFVRFKIDLEHLDIRMLRALVTPKQAPSPRRKSNPAKITKIFHTHVPLRGAVNTTPNPEFSQYHQVGDTTSMRIPILK